MVKPNAARREKGPEQLQVRFPLVLYNTGAKPIGNYSALLLCWASEVMWFGDADV
jgi:hypothetical protein